MTAGRIVFFLVFFGGILGSLHRYAWARLVRDPHLGAPWTTVGTAVLVGLFLVLLLAMPLSFVLPRSVAGPLAWVAYTWMGVAFFLVVVLAAGDLTRAVGLLAHKLAEGQPLDPERRTFIRRLLAGVAALATVSMSAVGLVEGLRRVRVKPVRIALRRAREANKGYRIVQLSDIHVGPTIGRAFIEDLVAQTNALEPDLIAITGDLVDGTVDVLKDAVAPLANLRAKDGVFFVTGNHEYYSGVEEWAAHLPTLGVRVLRNERVTIGQGPDAFDLAGVDDWSAHRHGAGQKADLARALEGRDPSRLLILLAHQPKQVVEAAAAGVDLQLSGHTHGGQMFPFGLLVRLQQPFVAGLHTVESTALYVSLGTGYWGPPMRLGAPAEITHIELATG